MSSNLDHHRGGSKSESVQKSTKHSLICYVVNIYIYVCVFVFCPSDVQKGWHIWHSGQVKSDDKLIGFSFGDMRQKAHYTCMLNLFRFFFSLEEHIMESINHASALQEANRNEKKRLQVIFYTPKVIRH